jgi:hypothetical protein
MVAGLAGTAGLLVNVNCGGGSSGGTGGTNGSGGTTATGGKGGSGTGGKGGSGTGGNATGGAAGSGTGGAAGAGTGGAAGAGGANGGSNGGSAGGANGGSAGGANGGSGGAKTDGGTNTDGGAQYSAFSFTFDSDTQGFGFNKFSPSDGSTNLAAGDSSAPPALSWDSSVGDPNNGSLEIQATFTGYRQFVQASVGVAPVIDPTGRTASVFVMLDKQDGGPSLPVGAQLEMNSTNFSGFAGTSYTPLTAGTWTKLTLPLTKSSSFDPSQIDQIAVQFITESMPDGGPAFGSPVHATFHVDTLTDGSGAPLPPPVYYTFDTSTQGWGIATSITTPDGGTAPSVSWDPANGIDGGSLKASVEFTGYQQNFSVQVNPQPFVNLTNKTITAHIKLDSGALPAGTSNYVQLHVSSGNTFVYANSPTGSSFTSTSAGTYMTLTFNLGTGFTPPTGFDATQISQIGIQVGINSGPDGGTFPTPTPLTFHIDSVISQ